MLETVSKLVEAMRNNALPYRTVVRWSAQYGYFDEDTLI